jgi:HEAT repeat protein
MGRRPQKNIEYAGFRQQTRINANPGCKVKKIILISLVLVALLALGAVLLDPTCTLLGLLKRESFYRSRPTTYWKSALKDSNPSVHQETLSALKAGGPAALPVLVELVRQPSSDWTVTEVRCTAADLLGGMGPSAREAAPALVEALRDPDQHVRSVAVTALGAIGADASVAVPALVALLKTEDCLKAVLALQAFGPQAAAANPALVELLKDKDPTIRWNTTDALAKIKADAPTTVPALVEALQDDDAKVREHCAEALGEFGPAAREAIPALMHALKDKEPRVRRDAVRSLGQLGSLSKEALPAVKALQKDEDKRVQEAATTASRRIEAPRGDQKEERKGNREDD